MIELLVVIAIIGILASLLIPALARAKDRALMIRCKSALKQSAIQVSIYTVDYNNFYPYRTIDKTSSWAAPEAIKTTQGDDTDLWLEHGFLENICPFIEGSVYDRLPGSNSYALFCYDFYFGYTIKSNTSTESTMARAGDRHEYDGHEFDILAADHAMSRSLSSGQRCSHPDEAGLSLYTWSGMDASYYNGDTRGSVDLNYCRTDGSVFEITGVEMIDDRLVRIPYKYNKSIAEGWRLLPPR